MKTLPYLCAKLIKTGYGNVLKSNDNRKVSGEKANVVAASGEGWFFFKTGWCEEVLKKVVLEPLAGGLGERLFYIMLL